MRRLDAFWWSSVVCGSLGLAIAPAGAAVTLDGQNIPTDATNNGLTQLAVQDTPTGFGDATDGTQGATNDGGEGGGSELNAMWAGLNNGSMNLSMTGNLEGNFNKGWIFFDAVSGGENPLAGDNADGGFGEINALEGMSFESGFTPDHGLRLEIGDGFTGVNFFDLIDNTAQSAFSGSGPSGMPVADVGSNGVTLGWDNSNADGVTGDDASGALTATKGWEFLLDTQALFGESGGPVSISALITSGDGTFASNQALPGIGGGENLGDPSDDTLGFVTIPTPSGLTAGLALLGGFVVAGRRRRA